MLPILISFLLSAAAISTCKLNDVSSGLTTTAGIGVFILTMFLISRRVRKKVAAVQGNLQDHLEKGQRRFNRDLHQFQTKPSGSPKAMQMQLEQKQKQMVRQALELVEQFAPLQKWSPLMGRQMNTMKLQFHYQLKEFDQVDALLAKRGFLSKPWFLEPMAVGMKMARLYANGDIKAVHKTFKKHVKWFRGDRGTLLYALMSWVYVKQGELKEAQLLLAKAKEKTRNEILTRNWECLANNNENGFSNKGFGEEWYALALETPPTPKTQRQRQRGNAKGQRRF